jgi:hypothetical protein
MPSGLVRTGSDATGFVDGSVDAEVDVEAPELEAYTMFIGLAAGEVGAAELAVWLADSCT